MPHTPTPTDNPTAVTPKIERQPNWTTAEDKQLCISWVKTSQNPEFANNQTGSAFYNKVAEDFNEFTVGPKRPSEKIRNHWKPINTATIKFAAVLGAIQRNPPSGVVVSDYIDIAKKEYHNQTKETFKLDECWKVVRNAPKWIDIGNGPQPKKPLIPDPERFDTPSNFGPKAVPDSPSVLDALPANILPARPPGSKVAKRERQELESREAADAERLLELKRASDLQSRRVDALEEGNRLAERALIVTQRAEESSSLLSDLAILNTSESNCPDEMSKVVLRRMKSILAKKYAENGAIEGNAEENIAE